MQLLAALLADPAVSPLLTEFDDSVEFIHPHSAHELLRGQLSIEREWGDTPVLAIFRSVRGKKKSQGLSTSRQSARYAAECS